MTLDELLDLAPHELAARHRSRFERAVADLHGLALFGAGPLGRYTAERMKRAGLSPLGFADNDGSLWGRSVDGLEVAGPAEAVRRWGSEAAFVVATYNMAAPIAQLRAEGARTVPYADLFAAFPDAFLPYFALERPERVLGHPASIREAYGLMADEVSRAEFRVQLERRLLLGFDSPREPLDPEVRDSEYFPTDVYVPLDEENFVDCGAFDGDTIRRFLRRREGRFRRIVALEPDPASLGRLRTFVSSLPEETAGRIRLERVAAFDREGPLRFDSKASVASTHSDDAGATVPAARLDELLRDEHPTLVKMDLEGSERSALEGGRGVFASERPVLAVCIYHRPEDLWEIPLDMAGIEKSYRIHLRAHAEDCWDASCYAVPPGRTLPSHA
jgi:FkbM family methyltransferase